MDDFLNITKRDPKVIIKMNNMLDRYNRLPYNYQSKIRYDTLIQNVFLKELINKLGTTITDLDIELRMKKRKLVELNIQKVKPTHKFLKEFGNHLFSKSCDVDS